MILSWAVPNLVLIPWLRVGSTSGSEVGTQQGEKITTESQVLCVDLAFILSRPCLKTSLTAANASICLAELCARKGKRTFQMVPFSCCC